MNRPSTHLAIAAMLLSGGVAHAQQQSTPGQSHWTKVHRVVMQVTQNDPAVMNLILNNAENLVDYFKRKNERIEIQIVAYGPGLAMMRADSSPVKARLAAISANTKGVQFVGCANTMAKQSKQEEKQVTLVPEAHVVPAGVAQVVELEEHGWTYVRP